MSNKFRNLGYIIGFSTILLILSSNLVVNNQKFLMAYPPLDKISFDDLNKYIIPVQGFGNGLGIPFFDSNRNLDDLKTRLCDGKQDNGANDNPGIPFLCKPSEGANDNSNNNQLNGDGSDKLDKKMEKLKEKLDNSIFNDDKNDKSQSQGMQLNPEVQDDDKQRNNNNDNNLDDNEVETKGLNLNLEKKQDKINEKIEKFNDKIGKENNGILLKQQEENKIANDNTDDSNDDNTDDNDKVETKGLNLNLEKQDKINEKIEKFNDKIGKENNGILLKQQEENKIANDNTDDNNDQGLHISGDLKIQNIQANLEKKIEKLKDKIENDKDNQRLIDHRQDNEAKDDDDEDNGDTKKGDGETYDGYRFNGDNE